MSITRCPVGHRAVVRAATTRAVRRFTGRSLHSGRRFQDQQHKMTPATDRGSAQTRVGRDDQGGGGPSELVIAAGWTASKLQVIGAAGGTAPWSASGPQPRSRRRRRRAVGLRW